jgi:hypothetical protein
MNTKDGREAEEITSQEIASQDVSDCDHDTDLGRRAERWMTDFAFRRNIPFIFELA